jgi:hypothetical protein
MTKILLMGSLVIDVSIIQKYIMKKDGKKYEDNNKKWIQFFSEYFIKDEDYIEITYNWTEGLTSDLEVEKIYNKINEIYKYYEHNKNKYKIICDNATKKANLLNVDIFNKTFEHLIVYFNEKIYEQNSIADFNHFLDKMILLDKNRIKINEKLLKLKENECDNDYFIKTIIFNKKLKISDKKYNVLTFGFYNKNKIEFIYENIIKKNQESEITIIYNSLKKIELNIKKQIKYISNKIIDSLLSLELNKYDIIFIFENNKKDLFQELILSWKLLNYQGYLVIDL